MKKQSWQHRCPPHALSVFIFMQCTCLKCLVLLLGFLLKQDRYGVSYPNAPFPQVHTAPFLPQCWRSCCCLSVAFQRDSSELTRINRWIGISISFVSCSHSFASCCVYAHLQRASFLVPCSGPHWTRVGGRVLVFGFCLSHPSNEDGTSVT